ncbi:minichromosome maintenance domain-containing protein 2-like [Gigantopelta aegis]|uniref:minichromosome maintenance domain-containing protein 2-like n=1 Tax=Gigantopelta aegis TaxID=1735272 RepID=UPI001B88B659|nr:minichromosome maintenance domain-containing protein 2-like [Gigantopelta aegis]XP_041358066.1 minichromosome maintenance domain-containing protein 2-like [Gigantopelta aegis]XP_041358067.1 minichromosome maintenance domain-containing protein 2-like [Gigantopelta aegis]
MEDKEFRLCLLKSAVEYLDSSGNIPHVKVLCRQYKQIQGILVYTFKIHLDPTVVTEQSSALGNLVLGFPIKAADIFQEVIFQLIQQFSLLPVDTTESQISVVLRLTCLPAPLQVLQVSKATDLSRNTGHAGFIKLTGVVTGFTGISKYTQSTKYLCPYEDCEGHSGNQYIRIHIPGASETQTIRNDFKCRFCGLTLVEVKSARTISDCLLAEIIPDHLFTGFGNAEKSFRGQSVLVYLRDDLCLKVQPGLKYEVIGLVRKDLIGEQVTLAIEANNIIELSRVALPSVIVSTLPKSITNLLADRQSSAWSFSLSLAYMFAGDIVPPGSFLKLKLSLLLSLAVAANNDKQLHVLAMGKETQYLHRLMEYGKTFSNQPVTYTAGNYLTANVTSDRHGMAQYFIEVGCLLLAAGGVCCINDLSRLKKSAREQLQSVLANNKISLELGSKHTGGLPQYLTYPLQCQVWAFADSTTHRKPQNQSEVFIHGETGNISKLMLDAFGLVLFTDATDSSSIDDIDNQMTCFTIYSAMNPGEIKNLIPITREDFLEFFRYIQQIRTKMTSSAEKLLQNYYLTSRRNRSSRADSTEVPVTALQTLISLSHGHAKLSLRRTVLEEDAVIAIRLYEETLTARLGFSVLSVQPCPHVPSNNIGGHLGHQNDVMMKEFHVHLLKLCASAFSPSGGPEE